MRPQRAATNTPGVALWTVLTPQELIRRAILDQRRGPRSGFRRRRGGRMDDRYRAAGVSRALVSNGAKQ